MPISKKTSTRGQRVVEQLTRWSLQTTEGTGSNPLISKFIQHFLCTKKAKTKEEETGIVPTF